MKTTANREMAFVDRYLGTIHRLADQHPDEDHVVFSSFGPPMEGAILTIAVMLVRQVQEAEESQVVRSVFLSFMQRDAASTDDVVTDLNLEFDTEGQQTSHHALVRYNDVKGSAADAGEAIGKKAFAWLTTGELPSEEMQVGGPVAPRSHLH